LNISTHICHIITNLFKKKFFLKEIPGVPKIREGYNPATWMLEVTSAAQEKAHGFNFSEIFKDSELYR
jgi:hypothetical protein